MSRSLRAAVVLLGLGVMLALASVAPTSEPDVFWHLATAREALRTGSWLPADPFSYSFAGAPWPYKDLAADVLLYSGFQVLGFVWFAVLKALCGGAMIAALHVAPRPAERSYAGTLVAGGVLLSSFWLLEQPALLSLTFFPVVLALVERARRAAEVADMRRLGQTLVAVVAVDALWTWMHRFALFGHALLALLALDLTVASLTRHRSSRPAPSPRSALLAALATVTGLLLGALNPNGLRAYTSGLAMASNPELRAEFWEWKQPSLGEMWGAFPVALVVSAVVLVAVVAHLAVGLRGGRGDRGHDDDPGARGAVRAFHVVLLASLAALACTSFRWMPYLAIASIFVGARMLGAQARVRRAPVWALAGCAGLLGASVHEHVDPRFTVGEDPSFAPAGAVTFAREHGLGGRVANAFDFGGYLLWHLPGRVEVFVDGRNEVVYPPAFVVRALLAEHDPATFAAMHADDGASWAFGVNFPGKPGFGFLARDPAWSMVYWSENAAVYTRRAEHPDLEASRFRYLDPRDAPGSITAAMMGARGDPATVATVGREIARMLDASPDSPRALLCLAVFHHLQGPSHRADRDAALDRLLRAARGDARYENIVAGLRAMPPGMPAR